MKKIVFTFILCSTLFLPTFASDIPDFDYKNIKVKSKILYDNNAEKWTNKVNKKESDYFVKTKGFGDFYDYLNPDESFAFTTDCEYEFIDNGSFIGYSNKNLNFLKLDYDGKNLNKTKLTYDEVQKLLPKYKIIKISDFSPNTNSLKIKKGLGNLKLFIYNDSEKEFDNFKFTSGNAEFETYNLNSFLTVTKKGMIQFSKAGESIGNNNWYVILVR